MPTLKDFGIQYAEHLKKFRSSPTIISDIANNIKGLKYTQSGLGLSDTDIDKIFEAMSQELSSKKDLHGGGFLTEAEDSSNFISMVQRIRKDVKSK